MAASNAFRDHYLAENGLTGLEGAPEERRGGIMRGSNSKGDLQAAEASAANAGAGASASSAPSDTALALETARGASERQSKFASNPWRQYKTLLGRELLSITRNPFDVAGRTLTFAWVGIVMGILYYGMPVSWVGKFWYRGWVCCTPWLGSPLPQPLSNPSVSAILHRSQFNASSARSRLNLVYMLLSFYCLMPYISMGLYSADKKFYLSDASSQLYRPLAYYLAKVRCGTGSGHAVFLRCDLQNQPNPATSPTRTHAQAAPLASPPPAPRSPPSAPSRSSRRSRLASPSMGWPACAPARRPSSDPASSTR